MSKSQKKIKIAIVGIGATGSIVFITLVKKLLDQNKKNKIEIYLIDKEKTFGPGLAYSTKENYHILNMRAETMSLFVNQPDHFLKWAIRNKKISNFNKNMYFPRSLFGEYIKYYLHSYLQKAKKKGIPVKEIYENVIDCKENINCVIVTLEKRKIAMDYVILAIGNMPSSNYQELLSAKGYFNNPWEFSRKFIKEKKCDIGILGSSLTAIDTVLTIKNIHCVNKIYLISRHSLFPKVQGELVSYKAQFLTKENLAALTINFTKKISFIKIVTLFKKELEFALKKPLSWNKIIHRASNSINVLKADIKNAQKNNVFWYSVLDSVSYLMPFIWNSIHIKERVYFIQKYLSIWYTYRHSIPLLNAKKMYLLMKKKKVVMLYGFKSVEYDAKRNIFSVIHCKNNEVRNVALKYLINSTGTGFDINQIQSTLLQNMVKTGEITQHPCGGVDVDFHTSQTIKKTRIKSKKLFFIGPLTRGVHFYTNAIDMNALAAEQSVEYLSRLLWKN